MPRYRKGIPEIGVPKDKAKNFFTSEKEKNNKPQKRRKNGNGKKK